MWENSSHNNRMTLYQSSFIRLHCDCDKDQQVLALLFFTCNLLNFVFSVSYNMIKYKRNSKIDQYKVLLQIFILACNRAALFTNRRSHNIFINDNLIFKEIFKAFNDIWPAFSALDSHCLSLSFYSIKSSV